MTFRGAEVNWEGPEDKTPLHIAAEEGDRTATKLLLRYGANVRAKDSTLWVINHSFLLFVHQPLSLIPLPSLSFQSFSPSLFSLLPSLLPFLLPFTSANSFDFFLMPPLIPSKFLLSSFVHSFLCFFTTFFSSIHPLLFRASFLSFLLPSFLISYFYLPSPSPPSFIPLLQSVLFYSFLILYLL